jgi:hypothetical protein
MELGTGQLAAISRLFSSSVIREMARRGQSPLFARLASETLLLNACTAAQRVYSLFDAAFSVLQREGNRDEYIYKAALTHKILLGTHSLHTASMLNEFRVGECKADLAILNGTATVYEVKSERDSLVRLKQQMAAYATVFARVYVVTADCYVPAVFDAVSSDVGVLVLNNRHKISTLREASNGIDRTQPAAIFASLRLQEARMILESRGIRVPAVPNTELHAALREMFIKLTPRDAHDGMVQVLKQTRQLLSLSDLVARLPHSLQTAALCVPLRKLDHSRLVSAVNTPLPEALSWC